MFNFFVRKYKNRVLLHIDRVSKGVNPDIRYALSIDEDEKFKEQKEVAEPKFSRKLDLDKKLEDKTGVSEPKYSKS